MVEAIQCPSCQTRYGLRPARVRTGLRRAQCFRCGDVFHIEPEVKRLLAEMGAEAAPIAPSTTANVPLATLAEAIHAPESASPALDANDLALPDLELPEPEPQAWPSPVETAPIISMAKAEEHPAASAAAQAVESFELPPVPEPETPAPADITGTYASAKDAISRLFGDTPLAPSPAAALRGALNRGSMDVDAGLKALEDTLGGVKPEALSTRPFSAPEAPAEPAPAPAAPMQEADLPHAASTVRLTAAEMFAAVGAPAAPIALPEPPEITQEEVTMVLPPPPPSAPAPALDASDPSALRLRIGDQVYGGLDLPTIAKWIEEGRVLEDHQVARGASETWMDAAKVPALRPVFERLRRGRAGAADLPLPPPPGIGDSGAKRGLFGGMFGKKD